MTRKPHYLRLALKFERGAQPIAGHVSDESGVRRDFIGWVQLSTAIEEALAADPPPVDRAEQSDDDLGPCGL